MDAPWFVDAAWRVTALFALGLAGAAALRAAPARARYALWAGVLAGAALLPGLGRWMPAVRVPLLPWSAAAAPAADEAPAATASAELAPDAPRAAAAPGAIVAAPARRASPAALLAALWLAGAVAALARLAHGLGRARALAAGATDLRGPWRDAVDDARRALPGLGAVRVCVADGVPSPATFGLRRPVVLLPRDALAWSPARRRIVLMHELVHVARRDWAVQIAAQLVRAAYWFHPLAHVAARRLAAERERACDERVVALGVTPSEYASHLLAIALALPRRGSLTAALAMATPATTARPAQLEGRLMSILNARPATRATRNLGRALVTALVLSVPALASIRPWTAPAACDHDHGCPHPAPAVRGAHGAHAPHGPHGAERAAAAARLVEELRRAERELAAQAERVRAIKAKLEALHAAELRGMHEQVVTEAQRARELSEEARSRARATELREGLNRIERERAERRLDLHSPSERIERLNREKLEMDAIRELELQLSREIRAREGEAGRRLRELERALEREAAGEAERAHAFEQEARSRLERKHEELRRVREEARPRDDSDRLRELAPAAAPLPGPVPEPAGEAELTDDIEELLRELRAPRADAPDRSDGEDAVDREARLL